MGIKELNKICKNSFIDHIGIRFKKFEGSHIFAEIQITNNHLQPDGVVHGGVYISMAETVAGAASTLLVRDEGKIALGVSVNSHHLASVTEGLITAEGQLIYKGPLKHIWDVRIFNEKGKLISISRVTNNIKKNDFSKK